jgi:FkbM family methyltransferase
MPTLLSSWRRAARLWQRYRAASRLGVRFRRAASFRLPGTLWIHGTEMRLSIPEESGQHTAFVELLLDDCYGLNALRRRGHVESILDIGANVGLFTLAARAAFPNARIHAYEPNPALEASLGRHARQVGADYFLEAVGRCSGYVTLAEPSESSVLVSTRPDVTGTIPQTALSEALRRLGGRADLVKLDCEGAEWELLDDRQSWECVSHLTMEYHLRDARGHDTVLRALQQLGFRVLSHRRFADFGLICASANR